MASMLHVHTEGSIRDSINKIENYIQKCVDYGHRAASMTDHGTMNLFYKFYKECKKKGIKPILGQEFYYTHDGEEKGENFHLVVYAKNSAGWKNLLKLSSDAYINNFYRKPRTKKEILSRYSEGLVVTPACCFGLSQQHFINNEVDLGVEEIKSLKSIFKDDFYLEVHDHGLDDEVIVRDRFRNLGRELDIKVVPGIDAHYTNKEDQKIHGIFKNIAYASGESEDSSFKGTDFHILSQQELESKFTKEELDNADEIADKCNISIDFDEYHLVKPLTEKDSFEYFVDKCFQGLKAKGLDNIKEYKDRLMYEIEQIYLMDIENYFLVVADYMNWCQDNEVPIGPGRGSSGGSLVCYILGITKIDPLKYDLIFERMLNPGRAMQFAFFNEQI